MMIVRPQPTVGGLRFRDTGESRDSTSWLNEAADILSEQADLLGQDHQDRFSLLPDHVVQSVLEDAGGFEPATRSPGDCENLQDSSDNCEPPAAERVPAPPASRLKTAAPLRRVSPRTDAGGERRRARLARLRIQLKTSQFSTEPAAPAIAPPATAPAARTVPKARAKSSSVRVAPATIASPASDQKCSPDPVAPLPTAATSSRKLRSIRRHASGSAATSPNDAATVPQSPQRASKPRSAPKAVQPITVTVPGSDDAIRKKTLSADLTSLSSRPRKGSPAQRPAIVRTPSSSFAKSQSLMTGSSPEPSKAAGQKKSSSVATSPETIPLQLPLAFVEPPPPEIESYGAWFRRVIVRNRWMTWFTTFYIHWLLLLSLAAIIVHGPDETARLLLNAAFSQEQPPETETFEFTPSEPQPVAEESTADDQEAQPVIPMNVEERMLDLDVGVLDTVASEEASESSSTETSHQTEEPHSSPLTTAVDRSPPTAVCEGSFSVWAEPSNPRPGEAYRIIIQIRLPDGLNEYKVSDLEGVVVGSDGYRKPVPGHLQGELPIVDGYARLAVPIVSGDKRVRDTVYIRSRLLKETQKLEIDFF
ncbi:MAG: hypothetical protein R3C49_06105 [Planctomycetaceae bacterium]